jgi:hypothetical protein
MLYKVLETTDRPLDANQEWTSAWYEEPWAPHVTMSASADQAGELFLEQSEDRATVLFTLRTAIAANVPYYTVFARTARYIRLRYKNGATAQTSFRATLGAIDTVH